MLHDTVISIPRLICTNMLMNVVYIAYRFRKKCWSTPFLSFIFKIETPLVMLAFLEIWPRKINGPSFFYFFLSIYRINDQLIKNKTSSYVAAQSNSTYRWSCFCTSAALLSLSSELGVLLGFPAAKEHSLICRDNNPLYESLPSSCPVGLRNICYSLPPSIPPSLPSRRKHTAYEFS